MGEREDEAVVAEVVRGREVRELGSCPLMKSEIQSALRWIARIHSKLNMLTEVGQGFSKGGPLNQSVFVNSFSEAAVF